MESTINMETTTTNVVETTIESNLNLRKHYIPNLPNLEKFKKSFNYFFTSVDFEEINITEARRILKEVQNSKKSITNDFIDTIYPEGVKQIQIIGTLENGKKIVFNVGRLLQINPSCFDGIIKEEKKDNKVHYIYDIGAILYNHEDDALSILTTDEAAK